MYVCVRVFFMSCTEVLLCFSFRSHAELIRFTLSVIRGHKLTRKEILFFLYIKEKKKKKNRTDY